MMRALGVHTYYGGFQLGVQRAGFEDLGSVETWPKCIEPRQRDMGLSTIGWEEFHAAPFGADLVYSNPPCSRYSSMSVSTFTPEQQQDLNLFPDLADGLEIVRLSGAKAFWWETGPLLWNAGLEMSAAVSQRLAELWDEPVTEIIVKLDLRWIGVPQRRPRCHVLHVAGRKAPPAEIPGPTPLPEGGIWSWIQSQLDANGCGEPDGFIRHKHRWPAESYRDMVLGIRDAASFMATMPRLMERSDPWAPAVLSGRLLSWEDRWWTIEEYAVLMCFPVAGPRRTFDHVGQHALSLLSKGISPSAAEHVGNEILLPTILGDEDPCKKDDRWFIDMS